MRHRSKTQNKESKEGMNNSGKFNYTRRQDDKNLKDQTTFAKYI